MICQSHKIECKTSHFILLITKYNSCAASDIIVGDIKSVYEDGCMTSRCAAYPPAPPIVQTKTFDLEQAMRELAEETELKQQLRDCRMTPYFKSVFAPKELHAKSSRTCCQVERAIFFEEDFKISTNWYFFIPVAAFYI